MNILYCEDNFMIREAMVDAIKESYPSANLTICKNGASGIEYLNRGKDFDLIISDYEMPIKTGLDVYNFSQKINPDIPFVMFSGSQSSLFKDYMDNKNFYFIQKLANIEELKSIINRLYV